MSFHRACCCGCLSTCGQCAAHTTPTAIRVTFEGITNCGCLLGSELVGDLNGTWDAVEFNFTSETCAWVALTDIIYETPCGTERGNVVVYITNIGGAWAVELSAVIGYDPVEGFTFAGLGAFYGTGTAPSGNCLTPFVATNTQTSCGNGINQGHGHSGTATVTPLCEP